MKRKNWRHFIVRGCSVMVLLVGWVSLAACGSKFQLMPTPNLYTNPDWNPFANVPPALQGDKTSLLYITDRVPEKKTPDHSAYGFERSRSAAFGECQVQIGENESWEELVQASRSAKRKRDLEMKVVSTREIARFEPTPPSLIISDAQLAHPELAPSNQMEARAEKQFIDELTARLAQTPRKEVFIYIHGFNNSFNKSMLVGSEIWHFLGREGVPIIYSWPAGMGGLRGYEYTVSSTEFTIFHLKQALRLIASCPAVQKIHILAHSRGTAVVTAAVRELYLEFRGSTDTEKTLKLGTVVLAAADLDLDVNIQRNATERIGRAVDRCALYVSGRDKALGFSNWLSGDLGRVGNIDPKLFTKEEIDTLRHSQRLQIIDADVKKLGSFNHDYYHANPAVSSDVILLLRYQLMPGAENGRPLGVSDSGFWAVYDGYPGAAWALPSGAESVNTEANPSRPTTVTGNGAR
jgi:esterase/lipase superfamily enzyme